MKKSILISAAVLAYCILHTACSFSQGGNLVFSRAKLIGTTEDTVPVNKVWKICAVISSGRLSSASGGTNYSSGSTSTVIKINGSDAYWASSNSESKDWSASASAVFAEQPAWLPEGTRLKASTGVLYISVLEFSITP